MKKKRKEPLRKCIVCGENKVKKELIRVVKTKDNEVVLDLTGKVNGRGAYLCKSIKCTDSAIKAKMLSKALKYDVKEELYDMLKDIVNEEA